MRSRILKFVGTAFAFAFISAAGTFALGFVVKGAGVSNAVVSGEATAKSMHRFHTMLSEIAVIEERALELARENNRGNAFGNI